MRVSANAPSVSSHTKGVFGRLCVCARVRAGFDQLQRSPEHLGSVRRWSKAPPTSGAQAPHVQHAKTPASWRTRMHTHRRVSLARSAPEQCSCAHGWRASHPRAIGGQFRSDAQPHANSRTCARQVGLWADMLSLSMCLSVCQSVGRSVGLSASIHLCVSSYLQIDYLSI